jgi:methoxymalonate biosynthesis acyl carrier protein
MNTTSSDHVKAEIRRFINESINIDALSDDENLFESGIVNSLFAVQLTTFIESRFGIEVGMDDLEIANFQSVNATADFVARKTAAR